MDYGVHLPLIDFGGQPFTLDRSIADRSLCAIAATTGYKSNRERKCNHRSRSSVLSVEDCTRYQIELIALVVPRQQAKLRGSVRSAPPCREHKEKPTVLNPIAEMHLLWRLR